MIFRNSAEQDFKQQKRCIVPNYFFSRDIVISNFAHWIRIFLFIITIWTTVFAFLYCEKCLHSSYQTNSLRDWHDKSHFPSLADSIVAVSEDPAYNPTVAKIPTAPDIISISANP